MRALTSKTQSSSSSRPGTPLGRGVAWRKLATLATSNGSCALAFSSALVSSHLVASPVQPPVTWAWCPWRRPLLPDEGETWRPVYGFRRPWYRPIAVRLKGIAFCASRLALATPAIDPSTLFLATTAQAASRCIIALATPAIDPSTLFLPIPDRAASRSIQH